MAACSVLAAKKAAEQARRTVELSRMLEAARLQKDAILLELSPLIQEALAMGRSSRNGRTPYLSFEGALKAFVGDRGNVIDEVFNDFLTEFTAARIRVSYEQIYPYYQNRKGYYVATTVQPGDREEFLKRHPGAGLAADDPNFWEKAAHYAGAYVDNTVGQYCHYRVRITPSGVMADRVEVGWDDEDPRLHERD